VTVRSGVAPGEPNALPLPSGTSVAHPGYLLYRVYLPAGGISQLTPPTLTWSQGTVVRRLPPCSTHVLLPLPEKAPAGTTPSPSKVPPPAGAFFKPLLKNYAGGLADANDAYVEAYFIRPTTTDVLVVSAKAPTFAPGGGPSPWPEPGEDMQYWSMCIAVGKGTLPTVVNQLPGGQVDYGCRADEATKLDAAGDYNYVVGPEAQRAAISKIPGATFLPFSSTATTPRGRPWPLYVLLLRNILVSPDFARVRGPLRAGTPEPRHPGPSVPGEPARDAPSAGPSGPGSSGGPALVVEHLSKRFGSRTAFDDVSFQVGSGEVFGFLGPNGAGKTTTVRTLGTLLAPTSGLATVAGIELRPENGPAIRSRISIMPESPGLYLRLTVAENLECFARLYRLADRHERIERALQAVNLADRANDLCRSLSKGLRQRVALARALLSDPAVLFLDEPTSGLDPVATKEVHELIAGLKDRGVTIFLTTHRLEEAERLCDRVAIQHDDAHRRQPRRAARPAVQKEPRGPPPR
jgi:ABC-type Na+ transport system ATPase subunit NatA